MKHTILQLGAIVNVDLGDQIITGNYSGHDACAARFRIDGHDVIIPWHNIKRITVAS